MIFVPAEAVTFGMGVSALQLLERRIAEDGVVLPGGILKVDGFLNHLMDPVLFTRKWPGSCTAFTRARASTKY